MSPMELSSYVKDVPDFPRPGIGFKDITLLLAQPDAFASTVDFLARSIGLYGASEIIAIESPGFIFGAAVSRRFSLRIRSSRDSQRCHPGVQEVRYHR